MEFIDIDGDPATLNSSTKTLELSNSGENGANQNYSNVLFAVLYWTGEIAILRQDIFNKKKRLNFHETFQFLSY
ncbi:hypothetical protein [Flavobacterium luteum]|uniref:Uncharacterized protein n=1 Tax=Flavobacterium luteum TaxID=2026654 RepID=A0A7J5A998_9FLAO|nr:hypothetical protein [Flavobacterium luteum]KAB1154043.1 hypothetical protein F6464_13740 [Flavobacterium luteum]